VPCIGTNVGGIPEVINHGVSGYICEVGDINDISEKAITLLNNSDLHQAMSEQALNTVKTKFKAEQIVEQYEKLYWKLLN
jgi:glycosyltransferase involved in cell wall biosynthesis